MPAQGRSTEDPVEDRLRPLYSVGQVAELLNVQQPFLRRLDQHKLVSPARSDGSQRRYSRSDIDAVAAICTLIEEGLTLEGVRRVLALQAEVAGLKEELTQARADLDNT
jgi:excisionase family DNA binding protein